MGLADFLSYAQLILATIGIIAVLHRFLFPNWNNVTEPIKVQPPVEAEAINIQQTESIYRNILATDDGPRKKLRCGDYSIGIITALPNEMKAAISVLDEEHGPPSDFCKPPSDYNPYVWGSMSTESEAAHNVVIASFPAKRPGTVTAADVARLMVTTFPSIRLGLMVGIGGGVPSPNDVRLGDIVVSQGSGTTGGVVQYDLGKEEEGGFRRQGQLNSPPAALLSAITALEARGPESVLIKAVMRATSKIQKTNLNLKNEPTYAYQGAKNDRLFQSQYYGPGVAQWPIVSSLFGSPQRSQPTHKDCANCDPRMLVKRDPRPLPEIPRIHYGLIASGNRVIKSARMRDEIVASLNQDTNGGDCLCFEMEAAGLMNNFPCLVIRGISDYADAHKNDMWHNYAALTAAAFARELVRVLSTAEVSSSKPVRDIIGEIQRG